MKYNQPIDRLISLRFLMILFLLVGSSFTLNRPAKSKFPYQQAGLTERQAAAHLISRFTFGASPNQVDEVVSIGLEKWVDRQLNGEVDDHDVNTRLKGYDALALSNAQVVVQFPRNPLLQNMALADGYFTKDSLAQLDKPSIKEKLKEYRKQKGLREEKELYAQFIGQKIIRAIYGRNQLHEVLTDFWFNHFNVSLTKGQCAQFIPAYERDVIRPHVSGRFYDLLIATAQSPAMLMYLDNAASMGEAENIDMTSGTPVRTRITRRGRVIQRVPRPTRPTQPKKKTAQGLNENYAREIMELHTLGVEGGYTQQDVTEAARILTGWTVYPMKDGNFEGLRKKLDEAGESQLANNGFVHEGDFLFAANRHDSKEKNVLGRKFVAGGEYKEGVELLKMLAAHPSTAQFISKKLAVRFVSDNPPQSLIDKMADTFLKQQGDLKKVLLVMVNAPEFWSTEALRSKTKSPFEYAISAARALNAEVTEPASLNQWVTRMGQQLYSYAAPTGFPDRGQYWINTGALLSRMNFGLAITSQRIKGVKIDLNGLNHHHEPESAEAALPVYAQLILPERDLGATLKRLMPLITNRDVINKVQKADRQKNREGYSDTMPASELNGKKAIIKKKLPDTQSQWSDASMLAQVVGIIIGSPEFQRR
ncbi:MAG: DUF1800 domain-containing protein [Bacteroidetes bacterium]|nr:DUF1800 domain-containing protein [Bacteroidota bacterium]